MTNKYIEEALESNRHLLSEQRYQRLMYVINQNFEYNPRKIFIVHEIPEQGEDIYTLALDGGRIVHVEIPRKTENYILSEESIDAYLDNNRKSKLLKRKLSAIRHLMEICDTE